MAKLHRPLFHRGKTSHAPSRFVAPPLPVISDQSLSRQHAWERGRPSMVISYGEGGYKIGKSRVRNLLCPPHHDKVKLFAPPLLKSPPPIQYGENFKLPHKNYPKTCCAPPSAWLPPPPFHRGKTSHAPSRFVAPPPSP